MIRPIDLKAQIQAAKAAAGNAAADVAALLSGYVTSATAAKDAAEAAAAQAQDISNISTTDDAMTAVASDPDSAFVARQSASIQEVIGSVYLRDYIQAGATTAANRTAYQQAIDDAAAAGKPLCYDGATFTFSGAAVRDDADDACHWATSWGTHLVTNETAGQGILRVAGERTIMSNLNLDGDNPDLDMTGVTAAAQSRHSHGVWLEPTAHGSRVFNLKVSGFMRAVTGGSFTPDNIDSATGVTPETFPPLTDIVVDGLEVKDVWAAVNPNSLTGMTIRNVRGSFKRAQGDGAGGADPHLLYIAGYSDGENDILFCRDITVENCFAFDSVTTAAFKFRAVIGLTMNGMSTTRSCGIFDLIRVSNFAITGAVCAEDVMDAGAPGATRMLNCVNGTVDGLVISGADGAATGGLVYIDQCTGVTMNRPRLRSASTVTDSAGVLTVRGGDDVLVVEPYIENYHATLSFYAGVLFTTDPGGAVVDPTIVGAFSFGARVAADDATLVYNPAKMGSWATQIIRIDSSVTSAKIISTAQPTDPLSDPDLLGWHTGASMASSGGAFGKWSSGQSGTASIGDIAFDQYGTLWSNAPSSNHVIAADFGEADVDITCMVKLGGQIRAGICLRAVDANNYVTVSRAAGKVRISKRVGTTTVTVLAEVATSYPDSLEAELRGVVVGNTVYAFLNGQFMVSYTLTGGEETTFVSSVHGIAGQGDATARWRWPAVRSA
ncbi:hypothetical protein M8330_21335 [Nocardioides sp. BSK12Z-4]|uniref:Uncharacterized protein n=2 Tax=Nocardioides bruguierae TaxID=2945102 RepID=A0A9X2IGF6_9ACTN|nr:hypothetical protein [Nocardioides bruguierae]